MDGGRAGWLGRLRILLPGKELMLSVMGERHPRDHREKRSLSSIPARHADLRKDIGKVLVVTR